MPAEKSFQYAFHQMFTHPPCPVSSERPHSWGRGYVKLAEQMKELGMLGRGLRRMQSKEVGVLRDGVEGALL